MKFLNFRCFKFKFYVFYEGICFMINFFNLEKIMLVVVLCIFIVFKSEKNKL